jgi:hypothetical protein
MRAKTAGIADIAQKAAGHAVFANDDRRKGVLESTLRVHRSAIPLHNARSGDWG